MKNTTAQMSLFLVAVAASSSAIASTCTQGFFDPLNGSACEPAQPGRYVPNAGATTFTLAEPGFYVPTSGASIPIAASAGYYVPNSGSSEAIAASRGFYTATDAATSQIPAGGLAAPLTAALQTGDLFNSLSTDLLDTSDPAMFKLATSYQNNAVDQDGLSDGGFNTDIGAVTLQANLLPQTGGGSGLQFSYGQHSLSNSAAVRDNGNSYEVGAFHSGKMLGGRFQAFLVYGQTDYDNRRSVTLSRDVSSVITTNQETLTSDGTIKWYGLRSQGSYPLGNRLGLIGQLGVLRYSTDSVNETGVATQGGSPTASIAGLTADDTNYVSMPAMIGVTLDLGAKTQGDNGFPATLRMGVSGNLTGTQDLRLTSPTANYSFDLPVDQTSAVAGVMGLNVRAWEIGNGFDLSGAIEGKVGTDSRSFRAGLNLAKRW